jgi:hypothetical protein
MANILATIKRKIYNSWDASGRGEANLLWMSADGLFIAEIVLRMEMIGDDLGGRWTEGFEFTRRRGADGEKS